MVRIKCASRETNFDAKKKYYLVQNNKLPNNHIGFSMVSNGRYNWSDNILCYVRGIPLDCTAPFAAMPHLDGITATTLAG